MRSKWLSRVIEKASGRSRSGSSTRSDLPSPPRVAIDAPRDGSTHPFGQPLSIGGWALFTDGPARHVEVRFDGRLLHVGRPNQDRPDVRAIYPEAQARATPAGFNYVVDLPGDAGPGHHDLEIFVLDDRGRRERGGGIRLQIVDRDSATSFSQRFAHLPQPLVAKVNGSVREEDFLQIGSLTAETIIGNVEAALPEPARRVLDFGCGLGRVLSPMMARLPEAEFVGFDIDPLMIEWLQYLHRDPRCRFVTSTLDLPDETFDLVIAISVFTHLDVTADYWLTEIRRLLAPHGAAFLTYQDETLFEEIAGTPQLPDVPRGTRLHGRHVVGSGETEGGAHMGTFDMTPAWEKMLAQWFDVRATVPRGLFGHQSFSVVAKRADSPDTRGSDRTYVRQLEQQLYDLRRKHRELF